MRPRVPGTGGGPAAGARGPAAAQRHCLLVEGNPLSLSLALSIEGRGNRVGPGQPAPGLGPLSGRGYGFALVVLLLFPGPRVR